MKEFIEAFAISLALVLGGYFLFGSLASPSSENTMEGMDMSGTDMPASMDHSSM